MSTATDAPAFTGIPAELFTFYEGLEADPTKAYWTEHKATYDACVAAPLRALASGLEPVLGTPKVFRPYRDVRFSKDKSPYKTNASLVWVDGRGRTSYLELSARGVMLAGGLYQSSTPQVQRLREAVADERTGPELVAVLDALRDAGWEIAGTTLVRVPKPWDADHPRAELLRHKTLTAHRMEEPAAWMGTPEAADRWRDRFLQLWPLHDWLWERVGGE